MGIFDIPRTEKLPPDLARRFRDIRYSRRKIQQRAFEQLRASSFPVCPRAYVIYRRSPLRRRPLREQTFVSESATLLGTSLHLVLQKWFGLEGSLYGHWVCVRCKKIKRNMLGTQTCNSCGKEMTYHEYEIEEGPKTPFTGHIDGILVTPGSPPCLIDFKGSRISDIRELQHTGRPKERHYLQVNAYAHAVNMNPAKYGLTEKIQKIIIIYVDRGEPWKLWLPMQVPLSLPLYRDVVGRIKMAKECLQTGRIPHGLCDSASDEYAKYCPWLTICFSPAIEGLLSDTVEPDSHASEVSEQELLALASYLKSH